MESKPNGWNFTIRSMAKQLKDGVDSISSGLKELRRYGYVIYYKQVDGTGIYELIDEPNTENQDMAYPNTENPNQGNPNLGKPKRISNKDYLIKKINREEEVEAFSQKEFIALMRKQYIAKPLRIDDINYFFDDDGFFKTYDGNKKLSNGRAMDLYKRLYESRISIIKYLESKYNKENK